MYKIIVPSKSFEGQRNGVQFRQGEAIVNTKEVADSFLQYGYEVINLEEVKPKAAAKGKAKKGE